MTPDQYRRVSAQAAGTQPETAILHAVRDWLRWHGWLVYRQQAGPLTPKGWPDLVCLRRGVVVGVECKTKRGRLSEHQKAMQQEWRRQGVDYLVARCVEDVEEMA